MTLNLSKNEHSTASADSLRNRIIFGFSGFFLMMGGMLWNEWSYSFVFLVICVVCQYEFINLVLGKEKKVLRFFSLALGIILYISSFLITAQQIDAVFYFWIYPIFSLVFIIVLYQKEQLRPFQDIGAVLLSFVYVVLPFCSLHWAVFLEGYYQYQIILGTFFIIWIHDIGSYFIGGRYGKTPLFPRISPKKSWEGSFAGGLMALGMAVLLHLYLQDLSLLKWLGMALIITVAGTHGDLVESMLKRSLQVKDSSQSLPGHGGFLDRFDNLLMSAPFIALFLKFF